MKHGRRIQILTPRRQYMPPYSVLMMGATSLFVTSVPTYKSTQRFTTQTTTKTSRERLLWACSLVGCLSSLRSTATRLIVMHQLQIADPFRPEFLYSSPTQPPLFYRPHGFYLIRACKPLLILDLKEWRRSRTEELTPSREPWKGPTSSVQASPTHHSSHACSVCPRIGPAKCQTHSLLSGTFLHIFPPSTLHNPLESQLIPPRPHQSPDRKFRLKLADEGNPLVQQLGTCLCRPRDACQKTPKSAQRVAI
jgi:hypothetical protein